MKDFLKSGAGFGIVAGLIVLMVLSPFALIWGVNELAEQSKTAFELPYNFWTWLSCLAIAFVLRGGNS